MTSTPKSVGEDSLTESWVDLSISPGRLTPVAAVSTVSLINSKNSVPQMSQSAYALTLAGEEYLRMLRDAQRESNHSSAMVSLASSRRDSRCESPKSPPNSPNTELSNEEDELQGIFINKEESAKGKDWALAYFAATCEPKKYHGMKPKLTITSKANLSLRTTKFAGKSLFSKEVMYTLFVSNFLSLILGAGIGLWLSKRSSVISQYPIN